MFQLAGVVEYTDCFSAEGVRPPPTSVKNMTENNRMGKALAMHNSPLLSSIPRLPWPGVVAPDRILSMGQIELKSVLILNWID